MAAAGRGTAHSVLWIERWWAFSTASLGWKGKKSTKRKMMSRSGPIPIGVTTHLYPEPFSPVLAACPMALESWTEFRKISEIFLPCSFTQVHPGVHPACNSTTPVLSSISHHLLHTGHSAGHTWGAIALAPSTPTAPSALIPLSFVLNHSLRVFFSNLFFCGLVCCWVFFLQLQKLWEHFYNNSHAAWFSRYLGFFILSCWITFGYQHALYLLSISCYLTPWNDLTPSACWKICPLPAGTACISLQRSRQFCHFFFQLVLITAKGQLCFHCKPRDNGMIQQTLSCVKLTGRFA